MKKYKYIIPIFALAGIIFSCSEDFLTVYPRTSVAAGAPATQDVIEQNLTGAYQILLFDTYANGQQVGITIFGDYRSDDIYKGGGDATDQPAYSYLAQYQSSPVDVPSGWWSIFYTGLKRCNGALEAMDNAVDVRPEVLARLRAEALTLRAYYVHWLWKTWGNIPFYDKAWIEEPFLAKQYTFDELYPLLIADLDAAINTSELPMAVSGAETGRINKAMAMMTKARVVMYKNDQSKYAEVLADMNAIINSGAYELIKAVPAGSKENTKNPIEWMFMREGEFCKESIFESNNIPEGKTWGNSWTGFGNYTPQNISPRDLKDPAGVFVSGWGWCPVQPTAYAVFNEAGDYRKEGSVTEWANGTYSPGYQDTGLWLHKYAARSGYNEVTSGDAPLNYENNERIYRLSEAYLNAAELAFYTSGQAAAQPYLDAIRDRAFGNINNRIPATLNNIKLERRRELFGEGHRFWDLVRWGSDETGRSIEQTLTVNDPAHNLVRTYTGNKQFLPIPKDEIDKTKGTEFELVQNPGWE
jgi:hypothetical protein